MSNSKLPLIIVVVVVLILAIGGYYFWQDKKTDDNSPKTGDVATNIQVTKTEIPTDQLPQKFPLNVPTEEGALITQNYNAKTPDGMYQSTRAFQTEKSLADNLAIYKAYLSQNGWKVDATVQQENYAMISGSKAGDKLQVSINNNTVNKVKTVSITLTTKQAVTPQN